MSIGRPPSSPRPRRSHPARRRARAALPLLLLLVTPATAVAAWRAPVPVDVARPFAVGPDRFARGQHRGVDLAAPVGTPVRAACGGRVIFAGRVARNGRTVSVRCGGLVATYLHLRAIAVRRGARVPPGGRIGTSGRSGRPSPGRPHLHLGARDAATGRYVDPMSLLAPAASPPPAVPALRPSHPPLGAAPRPAPRVVPRTSPAPASSVVPAPAAAPAPEVAPAPAAVPLGAWLGLALIAAGLPLGALVHRRRSRTPAPAPARAGGPQAAR